MVSPLQPPGPEDARKAMTAALASSAAGLGGDPSGVFRELLSQYERRVWEAVAGLGEAPGPPRAAGEETDEEG